MLETVKVAHNMQSLLYGSMSNCKTVLRSKYKRKCWAKWNIPGGGGLLDCTAVCSCDDPLTTLLKRENVGYKRGMYWSLINHLKQYGRSEEMLESLISVIRVFSQDIRVEFGLDKCAALVLKELCCWMVR